MAGRYFPETATRVIGRSIVTVARHHTGRSVWSRVATVRSRSAERTPLLLLLVVEQGESTDPDSIVGDDDDGARFEIGSDVVEVVADEGVLVVRGEGVS